MQMRSIEPLVGDSFDGLNLPLPCSSILLRPAPSWREVRHGWEVALSDL